MGVQGLTKRERLWIEAVRKYPKDRAEALKHYRRLCIGAGLSTRPASAKTQGWNGDRLPQ